MNSKYIIIILIILLLSFYGIYVQFNESELEERVENDEHWLATLRLRLAVLRGQLYDFLFISFSI